MIAGAGFANAVIHAQIMLHKQGPLLAVTDDFLLLIEMIAIPVILRLIMFERLALVFTIPIQ